MHAHRRCTGRAYLIWVGMYWRATVRMYWPTPPNLLGMFEEYMCVQLQRITSETITPYYSSLLSIKQTHKFFSEMCPHCRFLTSQSSWVDILEAKPLIVCRHWNLHNVDKPVLDKCVLQRKDIMCNNTGIWIGKRLGEPQGEAEKTRDLITGYSGLSRYATGLVCLLFSTQIE